jgi:NTP pyrophosphatase (non-canonical NTP hydrolase)
MSTLTDARTTIAELKRLVQDFVERRDWSQYHNPKDLGITIAMEAAELLEVFQWIGEEQAERVGEDPERFGRLKDELSDVVTSCLSLANVLDIDVAAAIGLKMEQNEAKYPVELARGDHRKYSELRRRKHSS